MTPAAPGTTPRRMEPVSYGQERLWLVDRLEPGSPAYNIARAIRLRGMLSLQALRESFDAVVARHESLRTTFAEVDGRPVQVIAGNHPVDLPMLDLSSGPEGAERESVLVNVIRQEARRPFDLAVGPLLRPSIVRLDAGDHVLVLVMHHIVTDAWSMSVLFRELKQFYEAATTGQPPALPPLAFQYVDFARAQRDSLSPAALERQLAFWRSQLAGAPPVVELPADRPRPAVRSPRGAAQRIVLPRSLVDQLKTVGRSCNATLFMTLLAAFQTLLSRYTGTDDIVVGSPAAGRDDVEFESVVGFFVNTLPLRADLSGDPSFRDLLARVREVALDAFSHQDAPFERIVEALNVPRSLSHTPLFQVMFMLQNAPRQTFDLPGLTMTEIDVDVGTAKFDLTVEVAELADGLFCGVEYSTDVFEHATMTRLLEHFENLLGGIAANPDRPLSALPLIDAAERRRVVNEWNDTAVDYPREQCLHRLFEEQAARTPDAVALIYRSQRVTYADLDRRASRLAGHLRARGVGRGVPVGICIDRSIDVVVGLLGVLKAGGAFVPMDPTYPAARLSFMLQDSRAPVLLTVERLLQRIPRGECEVVCLDRLPESAPRSNGVAPSGDVTAEDPAYIIYTSGSTGTPKGVVSPHRASVNRFAWMWRRWEFEPYDVCCQTTALSFVDAMWEIFGPLLKGVRNVIVPDDAIEDPVGLVDALAVNRVTRIVVVPSLLRLLLDTVPNIGMRLAALRFWVTSGEAIPAGLAARFAETFPAATLLNLYGSSEVAGDVTSYVIGRGRSFERVPIGKPIDNTRIYLLDRYLNPVPIGMPGQIHVAGDGLANGYLGNPELTSKKFIPDPFSDDPNARLFATGDRGRFLGDGNIEFLGRVDDQVKLRGVRIEPREIEMAVCSHPSVQAAVVTVAGTGAQERLVCHVVLRDDVSPPADLRAFIRQRLPDFMVPSAFVTLAVLPLTPNGKVDRRALAVAPADPRADRERERVPPRTHQEKALAGIFAEVLKLERIGVHDNFFELGGHSVLGIQVIARVRKVFRVELPLRRLFEEPTVAGLCVEIQKAEESGARAVSRAPARNVTSREQLLSRLAAMSDAEVDALLGRVAGDPPDRRVTEEF